MGKLLLVAGHGQGDPGAGGGGYNERDTMRQLVNKIKSLIPNLVDVYNTALDCYQQNGLASTSYKNVIEFHMDGAANTAACGGHVIISSGFSPDALDTALKNVIAKHIGVKSSLPSGFSYRNDLQNLNVAAQRGIAYRLLELGFISNASDRNKTIGQMDALAKLIAEAISGKTIGGGTTVVPPKVDTKHYYDSGKHFEAIKDCPTYLHDDFKAKSDWLFTIGARFGISKIVVTKTGTTHGIIQANGGNIRVTLNKAWVKKIN